MLDDEPLAVFLALENGEVVALKVLIWAALHGHQSFAVISAIVGQITGALYSKAVQGGVAGNGVHDVFEEAADGGLAGETTAGGGKKCRVGCVEGERGVDV